MSGAPSGLKQKTTTKTPNDNTTSMRMLTLFRGLNIPRLTNIAGLVFVLLLPASLFMLHIDVQHARLHSAYMKTTMQIYRHIGQLNVIAARMRTNEIESSYLKFQDSLNQLDHYVGLLQHGGQLQDDTIPPVIELLPASLFEPFEQRWTAAAISFHSIPTTRGALTTTTEIDERVQAMSTAGQQLTEPLDRIEQGITTYFKDLKTRNAILIIVSFVLMAITAFLFIRGFLSSLREKLLQGEYNIKHTQKAILRLLNEMENLASGDLTVRMSVTENMTGTIADAINLTIEELQGLVNSVDHASTQVIQTSVQAEKTSSALLTATRAQSQKIEENTITVLGIAESLETVSRSSHACAEVSRQSLKAAESGAHAVQDAINGMNEIRTYIQETAKRIKRLGESSQEIGEIVTLISDITEQTNVLALNAAIQAASAGEAGKGFSVIAQEIQRLAEHSAEATRQISILIRNIRGDTQDTIIAMERSTTGVVEGTRRANATGDALEEIETISKQLVQLVSEISEATRSQTLIASKIAKNMEDILAITRQTTEGTTENAESVKQIADYATKLKTSITRFKV
ncbi:MAG: methyl-accepting chemotaxis protein [Nitrosomonas sp.]|nr:methyl-accepting chemotaxis protein [Nitrosomonas sp.]